MNITMHAEDSESSDGNLSSQELLNESQWARLNDHHYYYYTGTKLAERFEQCLRALQQIPIGSHDEPVHEPAQEAVDHPAFMGNLTLGQAFKSEVFRQKWPKNITEIMESIQFQMLKKRT